MLSHSRRSFQRRSIYHVLHHSLRIHIGEGLVGSMDPKNRKKVSHVWRKVSTESSSQQGDGEKDGVERQVKILDQSISSHCSTIQHESGVDVGVELHKNEVEESEEEQIASAVQQSISVDAISSSQKHSVVLEVGTSLMRFIKGKGGATQEKIEAEKGAKIRFSSSREEDSIIIEGDCTETVTEASKRIQTIIDEAVNSPSLDYSHFVSLPLAIHPELVDKLVKFQKSILGLCDMDQNEILKSGSNPVSLNEEHGVGDLGSSAEVNVELKVEDGGKHVNVDITSIPLVSYSVKTSKASASDFKNTKLSELGIDKSIFIKPNTFHLTVLMLKLWNKERVEAAVEVLQSVSSKVMDALGSLPVSIKLKGLESMRGSFAKARVLYAPVEEIGGEGRLLRACQVIIDAFVEAGLVLEKDAHQKLKLHATVMNARHRKRKMRTKKADCFDARSIVDQYGSEEWGEYLIREAHLSQRFAFDENGYYRCCASIPFPENMQEN